MPRNCNPRISTNGKPHLVLVFAWFGMVHKDKHTPAIRPTPQQRRLTGTQHKQATSKKDSSGMVWYGMAGYGMACYCGIVFAWYTYGVVRYATAALSGFCALTPCSLINLHADGIVTQPAYRCVHGSKSNCNDIVNKASAIYGTVWYGNYSSYRG